MPCYVKTIKSASQEEYKIWQKAGYLGTYECYAKSRESEVGSQVFICGDLGDHCADCLGFGDFLCDYPVGDGKTCDRLMCDDHANQIGEEIHYCETHYKMWTEFKESGGVDASLKNVIAFKGEK